jgi:2-hydroxymuconate-semialdehyde hydrolase
MRQLVKAGTTRLTDAELQRVGVSTALVWGRHDPMFPLAIAEEASARLGWPLRIVEDAGHLPHVEQPAGFVQAPVGLTDRP